MSITEKELANTLYERHAGDHAPLDWHAVARHTAELLRVELAPEKPAPGWYFTNEGQVAQVKTNRHTGALMLYLEGEVFITDQEWPTLTPARVVPAAPVELTEEWVEKWFNDHAESATYLTYDQLGERWKNTLLHLANAVHDAHAAPVELPGRDEVRNLIVDHWNSGNAFSPSNIADGIMTLMGGERA